MHNKGPWRDFVNYSANGRFPLNTIAQKLFLDVDKAIIDGNIIVKLVNTLGQEINWDNLRGQHYYSPGDNFNDKFNYTLPLESDDDNVCLGYCVYIHGSRRDDCEGDGDEDGDRDQDEDYEPLVQSEQSGNSLPFRKRNKRVDSTTKTGELKHSLHPQSAEKHAWSSLLQIIFRAKRRPFWRKLQLAGPHVLQTAQSKQT